MTWSGERPIGASACGRFKRKVISTKSMISGMSCSTHKSPSPQPPRHHAVHSILATLYVKYLLFQHHRRYDRNRESS